MTDVKDMAAFKAIMKDLLQEHLTPINDNISALTDQLKYMKSSIDEAKASAENAHSVAESALVLTKGVDKRTAALELELQECKAQQHKLSEKTLSMETHSRRENLKFDGIKESRGEDCFKTIKQNLIAMDEEFEIISLDRVHRLGPYKPNRESDPRTVIVKFTHYVDRERVWSKRNSLKGTHTWVKEDYPREIEQRRKKLWPFLRAARAGDLSNPDNRVTAHLRGA